MPFTFEQLPDEPIYIFTYTGRVSVELVMEGRRLAEAQIAAHPVNSVIIFDTTQSETDFRQILELLRTQMIAPPGREVGVQITVLPSFVGTSALVKLFVDGSRQTQFGARQLPLFSTRDDAITAMRVALANIPQAAPST